MLPDAVPHADAAHAAGRSALLVEALCRRPDLLLPATEDRLHQDYRGPAMPDTIALVRRLRRRGVAAVVSGAGPTVLALSSADRTADLGDADELGLDGWQVLTLPVATSGAQVL